MNHDVFSAMSSPSFYPGLADPVTLIETHISRVYIAGDDVYKVKKAVDFGFLDFTTLAKRKFFCEEEVRLNRRLAPQVYLGVVAISRDMKGEIVLGEGETVLEYAVHMKKIPAEKMLKKLLLNPGFDPLIIDTLADRIVRFHQDAETGGLIDETGGMETISRNHEENFSQTEAYIEITLPSFAHAFIRIYARRFLTSHRELFENRIRDHRIRDCHGDLHLEHIVIDGDDIIIFDCIEFNERFRYADVAAEVAFLAMDLDFNGYPDLAARFVRSYASRSGDGMLPSLIPFYKCYYAFVRGKVTGFRIQQPDLSAEEKEKVIGTARRYFDLALHYAAGFEKPTLVIMSGLMGSGKSVVAGALAPLTGAALIRMDRLRKEILAASSMEHRLDDFGTGIYTPEKTAAVYKKAFERAEEILAAGGSVFIDASFKKRAHRTAARDLAAQCGAEFFVLECICSEDCARERLALRIKDDTEVSDGRPEILTAQREDFDAIIEFPETVHLRLETEGEQTAIMLRALSLLRMGEQSADGTL